jgi:alanine dehydrogenase
MIIGTVKEIKADEYRVSLTPAGARELTTAGHQVLVERGAGVGSSISDDEYVANGA